MTNDEISAEAIADGLNTRVLGRRVVYYARIGSTNDAAKQLADAGAPEGALVIADEQTAGRGRLGRTWFAPPRASILMSLLLRPALAPQQATRVTMAVALGVCDALRAETGLNAQIKWHNDILVSGKKCTGILAESGVTGDRLDYVVVGMGLNVNFAVSDHPDLPRDVTTIADELGKPTPRAPLVQAIVRGIETYYLRLCAGKNPREEFIQRLGTLHQSIRAQTPWGIERGIAEDVDEDGALMLRRADGSIVRLIAGDVTLALNQDRSGFAKPDRSAGRETQ